MVLVLKQLKNILSNIQKKFLNEINYLFFDLIFLLSHRRKSLKSKFSPNFYLNQIRISIYRLPNYIFYFLNKKYIYKLREKYRFKTNFTFSRFYVDIDSDLLKEIEHIYNNGVKIHSGAMPKRTGLEDNIKIDKNNFLADYVPLTEIEKNKIFLRLFDKNNLINFFAKSSLLSGYKVYQKDLIVSIGKTMGENSNSDWHSDAFYPVIKGFIYLVDISKDDAPFEIIEGSSQKDFLSEFHDESAISGKFNSPRISNKKQLKKISKLSIFTHVGKKGSGVIANTSALHRKGKHNSTKIRFFITFEFKRLRLYKRFWRSFQFINHKI